MSGGAALEAWAAGRARRELRLLVDRAPRVAHRHLDGRVEEVPVDAAPAAATSSRSVRASSCRPTASSRARDAVVDESALTGEPLPVTMSRRRAGAHPARQRGQRLRGCASPDPRRTARTPRSCGSFAPPRATARGSRGSPTAMPLLPPVHARRRRARLGCEPAIRRGLAVMVVATPCPLILAAPIAFVGGLSRAAERGVIVKGPGCSSGSADARTVLLDKTGTLTSGTPEIERVVPFGTLDEDETLRLAASLDQLSVHVLAESLVAGDGARARARRCRRRRRGSGPWVSPASSTAVASPSARTGWLESHGVRADGDRAQALPAPATRPARDRARRRRRALAGAIVMADRLRAGAERARRGARRARASTTSRS